MQFDRWIGRAPVQRPTALSKSRTEANAAGEQEPDRGL